MSENVKPERDYSKPVSEEQEALLEALCDLGDEHWPEAQRPHERRLLAEFVDRLAGAPTPEMIDADEILARIRATTWDAEHDRETFSMSRPAALELLTRLSAAPAPGVREAAEECSLRLGIGAGRPPVPEPYPATWADIFERILLSRLGASGKAVEHKCATRIGSTCVYLADGTKVTIKREGDSARLEVKAQGRLRPMDASGKAGWTKEIPRGKYGDLLPFWWRDDTYSKRIVEMVIGVDGVASHPTWAITPTAEWCPIPVPEE